MSSPFRKRRAPWLRPFQLLTLCCAIASGAIAAPRPTAIIPQPAKLALESGKFCFCSETAIQCDAAARQVADYFQAELRARGWSLAIDRDKKTPVGRVISFRLEANGGVPAEIAQTDDPKSEAYKLHISPGGIEVRANSSAGLFAGAVTLLQIVANADPGCDGNDLQLLALRIEDAPRYEWRGLMLDESRHLFGKAAVKELLDTMAYLKLNRFHWHLTDETGWRIEIKKYPQLTEIGAAGNSSDPKTPPAFYTQEDIRQIVAYAAARHIMIVPEIDFPGHASAATRAYPELSGGGAGKWRGFTFNPAHEDTYQFMAAVLTEVADLFPGPYIHIGGDEVSFGNQDWSTDPEIVKFTHDHGLKNAVELEAYAVRRVAEIVCHLGKTPIGWDEIVRDGVPAENSIALWWHHDKPNVLQAALRGGYRVVLCPRIPCYFDFVQLAAHQVGRRWDGAFVDLPSVYRFPEFAADRSLPAAQNPAVQGIEACVWTERIQNRHRLYFMINPRLAALAEAAWTPADAKDYAGFIDRLPALLRELDRRHIPYFDPFSPTRTPEPAEPSGAKGLTGNG